jgi:hypothetical protein
MKSVTERPLSLPLNENGLSGYFGNIGRSKNNYQYWTTEYTCTNGRPDRAVPQKSKG